MGSKTKQHWNRLTFIVWLLKKTLMTVVTFTIVLYIFIGEIQSFQKESSQGGQAFWQKLVALTDKILLNLKVTSV